MTRDERYHQQQVLDALDRKKYDHPPAEVSRERERVLIREAEREAEKRRNASTK